MCQVPGQKNWKLFGITAGGRECTVADHPAIFTRVAYYTGWIQNILDQEH